MKGANSGYEAADGRGTPGRGRSRGRGNQHPVDASAPSRGRVHGVSPAVLARGERILAPKAIVLSTGKKRVFNSDDEDDEEIVQPGKAARVAEESDEDMDANGAAKASKPSASLSSSSESSDERAEGGRPSGSEENEDAESDGSDVDASADEAPGKADTGKPGGSRPAKKKKRRKRRSDSSIGLPAFLANPIWIPSDIVPTPYSDPSLSLDPAFVALLNKYKHIPSLFPVQAVALPHILENTILGPKDVLISAPTGSGKTLAYVLPVISNLMHRKIPRIRCLAVLPTRELARQVRDEFERFARGTGLRVGLATSGSGRSLEAEGVKLTDVEEGYDLVDILVATPGRLLEHLDKTPGFTLQHLRFLIIDEADGLLKDEFRGWLDRVLDSAEKEGDRIHRANMDRLAAAVKSGRPLTWSDFGIRTDPVWPELPKHTAVTVRRDLTWDPDLHMRPAIQFPITPLQKILCSATLTRNPAKLAPLNLKDPVLVSVRGDAMPADAEDVQPEAEGDGPRSRYALPATLKEKAVHVDGAGDKPLVVLHLAFNEGLRGLLVFTRSVEAAGRLARLFKLVGELVAESGDEPPDPPIKAAFLSSALTAQERKSHLRSFVSGDLAVLVCTDLASRGLDLGASVRHVVNYDPPGDLKAYVHRVGRTARAGREGTAWSVLLQGKETGYFAGLMEKEGREGKVKRVRPKKKKGYGWDRLSEWYEEALGRLGREVHGGEDKERMDVDGDDKQDGAEESAESDDGDAGGKERGQVRDSDLGSAHADSEEADSDKDSDSSEQPASDTQRSSDRRSSSSGVGSGSESKSGRGPGSDGSKSSGSPSEDSSDSSSSSDDEGDDRTSFATAPDEANQAGHDPELAKVLQEGFARLRVAFDKILAAKDEAEAAARREAEDAARTEAQKEQALKERLRFWGLDD
ncbi:P-loop containing nucleoside triphosphate hydrolase protein [Hyaloraphidium curvatum]|nr:P-loop containing nucleoside triphosphate hydrolase protein [Hyaloraphidium curvatum]